MTRTLEMGRFKRSLTLNEDEVVVAEESSSYTMKLGSRNSRGLCER